MRATILRAPPGLVAAATLVAVFLGACASHQRAGEPGEQGAAPAEGFLQVEDAVHGARYELPPFAEGWQVTRDGTARAGPVQVEVATFAMARAATAAACRDTARARLTGPRQVPQTPVSPRPAAEESRPGEPTQPLSASHLPRDQTVGDAPTATWSFTRGPESAPLRSRWAFFARGADCVMLEVTAPRGDALAESAFQSGARSFKALPLPPERQREVDLLAGMGFLERRQPEEALERFEALSKREPAFAKAHFGALMAGFELGPAAYGRALPHGTAALGADRDLTPEQRQIALRAVGVMQLAQDQVKEAVVTLAELIVRVPDLAEGQYNYACALARLGDSQLALQHLKTALDLDRELTAHARQDEDLKVLRGKPEFEALVK